jgi:ABC-type lipoprotein export system ATPase subunit
MIPAAFAGKSQEERQDTARKYLEAVGLSKRLNHKSSELSGGEQQRVAIARALINTPDIIVADEPTGNIDSKTGHMIMDILSALNKKEGKTIIVVTHEMGLASYAGKVINIKDGQIIIQ